MYLEHRNHEQRASKKANFLTCTTLFIFLLLFFSGCRFSNSNKENSFENKTIANSIYGLSGDDIIDSLLTLAVTAPLDTNLVMLYYEIAEMYEDYDFENAKKYYQIMGNLSEQLNWNQGHYWYAIGYSHVLMRQGIVDSALVLNLQILQIAKEEKNEFWIGKLNYSLGNAYLTKQWFETALNYYVDALSYFEKTDNVERLGAIYYQLCLLYNNIDAIDKSIEFGEKAIAIDPDDCYYLYGIATAYSSNHQFQKADKYYERAIELCNQDNNMYLLGVIYYDLSKNYIMMFEVEKAEEYAQKSLIINRDIENFAASAGALSMLGKVEELKGNFNLAEDYVREALQLANEFGIPSGIDYCYTILSELSIAQGKFSDNINHWKELELIKNEMATEASLRAASELEAKYETEKKILEIERQKHIINTQNTQRSLFIGSIMLCVIVLILFYYMMKLQQRRNKALEELNATKDNFFSIISHDLKNPALAQRNALQMLLDNMGFWDEETLKKYYISLLKSAEGQVDLLYNLLNWAQVQAGRMPFQPVSFDLASELKKTDLALLQNMAKQKGIVLNVKMPKTALVTGDVNMITTIVRNLISNSIKFTQPLGRVNLSVMQKENEKYLVAISDTGVGMSEEQIIHLFSLSHQISKRGTAGEQGMGLGLIVCKDLLDKHHIRLHVKSKIDKGSCFWFEI
jgi:signal transduction histidine kinase